MSNTVQTKVVVTELVAPITLPSNLKNGEIHSQTRPVVDRLLQSAGLPADTPITANTLPFNSNSETTISQLCRLNGSKPPAIIYETIAHPLQDKITHLQFSNEQLLNLFKNYLDLFKENEKKMEQEKIGLEEKVNAAIDSIRKGLEAERKVEKKELEEMKKELKKMAQRNEKNEKELEKMAQKNEKELEKMAQKNEKSEKELEKMVQKNEKMVQKNEKLEEKMKEEKDERAQQFTELQIKQQYLLKQYCRYQLVAIRSLLDKTRAKIYQRTGETANSINREQLYNLGLIYEDMSLLSTQSIGQIAGNVAAHKFSEGIIASAIFETEENRDAYSRFFKFVFNVDVDKFFIEQ